MTRVLIVGTGLIGASLGLALVAQGMTVVGTDINKQYESQAVKMGALTSSLAEDYEFFSAADISQSHRRFDLVILAVPIQVACQWLPRALRFGEIVMDVCSVKTPFSDAVRLLSEADRLRVVPSHPMSGKASAGPSEATADLFVGQPWLYIRGYPAVDSVLPLFLALGAKLVPIDNEQLHDEAMAVVSHCIHLASLSSMLAYGQAEAEIAVDNQTDFSLAQVTGPGFRDITRLSASPTGFWAETLLSNRDAVGKHLDRLVRNIEKFQEALRNNDKPELTTLLDEARKIREKWAELQY